MPIRVHVHRTAALMALAASIWPGLCVSSWAQASGRAPDSSPVTETRLPDGLIVLTKEVHAAPVVCTNVWYRVGSRNEVSGATGISHQLEHMMFKGTRKLFPNPGYIDLLVGRYGGENNAQTDTDTTNYYLLLPNDQLDLALRIEADRMTQAAINGEQLRAERRVVLSELEGDENSNAYFLYENTRAAAYRYHPYHYPVGGTLYDVEHLTRNQVTDYYRNHYAPGNAVLVVVGDFDTSHVLTRIRDLWRDVKPGVIETHTIDPEPPQRGERRIVVRRAGSTSYLELMYHIPAAASPDLAPLTVLATALTEGRSSRLYRALVETQLATDVNASANQGIDPEVFDISASMQAGIAPEKAKEALLAEVDQVQTDLLDGRELQKAKNQTRADFIFAQESIEDQAARLGFYQIVTGDWRNLSNFLSRIDAVTAEDVRRVARTYLTADNRTVGSFVPNGAPANPGADQGGGHGLHYRPTSSPQIPHMNSLPSATRRAGRLPLSPASLPRHPSPFILHPSSQERRLPNGLTVIVRANHANPTVTIGGFVRTGSVDDPAGKFGLASMVGHMLTRGTLTLTSQQIADRTDFVGASLGVEADRERTDVSAVMLKENFDEVFSLLADCLRHPSFPASELDKLRGETLTALEAEDDDTASVATDRLYEALYPADNPYRHRPEGRPEDIRSITGADLSAFYGGAYRPERTTLVIVGDVSADAAFAEVEKRFGDWRGEGEPPPGYVPPPLMPMPIPKAPIVVTLNDKSQDDVAMGEIGLSRNAPDYVAASLMNLILGGDPFVGRVGKRVRDTEGLAYFAYTTFAPGLEAGPFVFRAEANPNNVAHALASARAEITRMAASGATSTELAWARDHAIGSLRLTEATNAGIAGQLENDAFYKLGLDYDERYPGLVRGTTLAQVDAAARRYLHPSALTVVVAGPPLPAFGAVPPPGGATGPKEGSTPAAGSAGRGK